ncbi:hypothetical protein [Alkalibacillus silvisoli]|uniref:DUF3153 domain-containing protein n=1 Tax=Alkalibacillus silvisoli TaxID=392823 RepID=A0ABN1A7P0_9BACI
MRSNRLLLLVLLSGIMVLAACGEMTLELEKDGSGEVFMEIPNNGMISPGEIESQLESQVEDSDQVSGFSVNEGSNSIRTSFQFDNISAIDPNSYIIPVSDYVVAGDSRLDELHIVDEEMEAFESDSTALFVRLPGDLQDFETARVEVSGEIVAHSEELELVNDDTVEVESRGEVFLVFEPSSGLGVLGWGMILLLPIAGGVFFYLRRNNMLPAKEAKKEGDTDA